MEVGPDGAIQADLTIPASGWPEAPLRLAGQSQARLHNVTPQPQLLILERTAWSEQAATAADVLATQAFRDLFTREVLRPGEQIAVGPMALLFTDLCESTRLYDEIGDAAAFGQVIGHFDLLKQAVEAEGGAVVKTIGDAVMAVFTRPAPALRAALRARQALAGAPGPTRLVLKAGLHYGPCIAVTLNERLDYFGSTVNLAARLHNLAPQGGVVLSESVAADPETAAALHEAGIPLQAFESEVRGLKGRFRLWKIS